MADARYRYDALCTIAAQLLDCGWLDLDHLVDEYERLGIRRFDFDFRDCLDGGRIHVNDAWFAILQAQAESFLDESGIESADYEIDANSIASRVWFRDPEIQERFDDWQLRDQ